MKNDNRVRDAIDHRLYPVAEGSFLSEMDTRLRHLLRQSHPDLQDGDFISYKQLTPYRMQLLEEIIDQANCKNEFIREAVHGVAMMKITLPWISKTNWIRKLLLDKNRGRRGSVWGFLDLYHFLYRLYGSLDANQYHSTVWDCF